MNATVQIEDITIHMADQNHSYQDYDKFLNLKEFYYLNQNLENFKNNFKNNL